MTNGHPGAGGPAGGPQEREGDDRAGPTGPAPPRGVSGPPQGPARPSRPTARPPGQQPWSPEQGRGRLDPARPGPVARQPVTPPPPGQADRGAYGGMFSRPDIGTRDGGHEAGQAPWTAQRAGRPGQAAPAGPAGAPVHDRYPPVGGFTGPDDPSARHRGWQQGPGADVWAPGPQASAYGSRGGGPADMWQEGQDDPFGTQPGTSRTARQRIAATGGARVRRVWPQRLALAVVILVAAVVCWFWLFPIIETALPSEF
jgi:hypothetical protein